MVSLDWVLLGLRVLTIIILYTFLGFAFYIIWRDLKRAGVQPPVQPETWCQLRVIASDEYQSLVVGQALPLQSVTLLGRDRDNTIVLNDDSTSGRHACISQENGVLWLEDLGSRNGTTLNELPLSKPASLTNGDIIGIGRVRFRLELDELGGLNELGGLSELRVKRKEKEARGQGMRLCNTVPASRIMPTPCAFSNF